MKNCMTFKDVRNMFFETYPMFKSERENRKKQNDFSCDCRCAFVDFTDYLYRNNMISEAQRSKITLIG